MSPSSEDKELEDYLSGRSDISRRYKAMSAEEPPAQLDRAVLAKARAAVEGGTSKVAPFRRSSRWMVPFAAAATVVLSYAIFREVDVGTVATQESPVPVMTPMPVRPSEENHQAAVESEESQVAPAAQAERDLRKSSKQAMPSELQGLELREKTEAIGGLSSTAPVMNAPVPSAPPPATATQPAKERSSAPPPAVSSDAAVLDSLSAAKAYAPRSDMNRKRGEAKADAESRTPEAWLEEVRKLRAEGKQTEADAELKSFLEAYPDYFEKNPHIERP